jgi:hypothetical protein
MLMRQFSCKENRKTFAGYIKTQSGGVHGYLSCKVIIFVLAQLLNQIQHFFIFEKEKVPS